MERIALYLDQLARWTFYLPRIGRAQVRIRHGYTFPAEPRQPGEVLRRGWLESA